jgi:hypothetical protein
MVENCENDELEEDSERNGYGQIKVLNWDLPGGNEKNHIHTHIPFHFTSPKKWT